MIWWILLAVLLATVWLIGMIRATLEVEYNTDVRLTLRLLGMRFQLSPKQKKPLKLSDFTPKKYRKRLAKDEAVRKKQAAKKAKRQAAKAKKKAEQKAAKDAAKQGLPLPTAKDGKKAKQVKGKKDAAEIMELVLLGLSASKGLFRSFGKHFRIEAARLKITVGSPDAATTAILYGLIVQFVTYLCHALDAITNFQCKNPDEISVIPDFLSDKLEFDLHLFFRLRVWHLFAMLISAGIAAVKHSLKGQSNSAVQSAQPIQDQPAGSR